MVVVAVVVFWFFISGLLCLLLFLLLAFAVLGRFLLPLFRLFPLLSALFCQVRRLLSLLAVQLALIPSLFRQCLVHLCRVSLCLLLLVLVVLALVLFPLSLLSFLLLRLVLPFVGGLVAGCPFRSVSVSLVALLL
jgi:hypothetical protein